jgi:hypothetical protein
VVGEVIAYPSQGVVDSKRHTKQQAEADKKEKEERRGEEEKRRKAAGQEGAKWVGRWADEKR